LWRADKQPPECCGKGKRNGHNRHFNNREAAMKFYFSTLSLAAFVVGLGLGSAQAASNRLYVSIAGSDAANCQAGTPCRYFARAISVALPGSEIDVLTPGNYGLVTITKALSIVNDSGGVAVISPVAGDGVRITAGASDAIYLRGLTIKDLGSSSNGINFVSGGALQIIDCDIHDFTKAAPPANGIFINPTTPVNFTIANTISSNNNIGIDVMGGGSSLSGIIKGSIVRNNSAGGIYTVSSGPPTWAIDIVDSAINGNNTGVFSLGASDILIRNSDISSNSTGLFTQIDVNMRISHSVIHGNSTYGYYIGPSGILYTYGDNVIDGNAANFGTLTLANLQ
jgi:hypothetical protein